MSDRAATSTLDVEGRRQLLLARLSTVAARLRANRDEEQTLFSERLALYQQLRGLDPPTTLARIADAAGLSDDAVSRSLAKS